MTQPSSPSDDKHSSGRTSYPPIPNKPANLQAKILEFSRRHQLSVEARAENEAPASGKLAGGVVTANRVDSSSRLTASMQGLQVVTDSFPLVGKEHSTSGSTPISGDENSQTQLAAKTPIPLEVVKERLKELVGDKGGAHDHGQDTSLGSLSSYGSSGGWASDDWDSLETSLGGQN